jgi:23S rRNA pseudouridine2605 synthase
MNTKEPQGSAKGTERIAKRLARAGVCSRREAERMIADGRVAVDGETLTSPAISVTREARITVDGKPVAKAERTRLWRFHKPRGVLTTHRDPEGRPTVFDGLPKALGRLISVGRLDYNSEGLLLLTNDGGLARRLELPSGGWIRRYRVRAFGKVDAARLKALAAGITIDGVNYGPIQCGIESQRGDNSWLMLSLREGKNREIRRVMEHLGLTVNRLIRIGFGPFALGKLKPGAIEEVPAKAIAEKLRQEADMPGKGATPGAKAPKAKPRAGKPTPRRGRKGGQAHARRRR